MYQGIMMLLIRQEYQREQTTALLCWNFGARGGMNPFAVAAAAREIAGTKCPGLRYLQPSSPVGLSFRPGAMPWSEILLIVGEKLLDRPLVRPLAV